MSAKLSDKLAEILNSIKSLESKFASLSEQRLSGSKRSASGEKKSAKQPKAWSDFDDNNFLWYPNCKTGPYIGASPGAPPAPYQKDKLDLIRQGYFLIKRREFFLANSSKVDPRQVNYKSSRIYVPDIDKNKEGKFFKFDDFKAMITKAIEEKGEKAPKKAKVAKVDKAEAKAEDSDDVEDVELEEEEPSEEAASVASVAEEDGKSDVNEDSDKDELEADDTDEE